MKTKSLFTLTLLLITLYARNQPLQTIEHIDLERYMGRWYDIASYPAWFQKGCRCTTADYELVPDKKYIRIVNRCVKFSRGRSRLNMARGKATIVEGSDNARLKVRFFWPFRGDYYILGIAEDYSWAVVGHPRRKYLWILYRESYMPADTYNQVLRIVKEKGYDLKPIQKTPQNCDNPD